MNRKRNRRIRQLRPSANGKVKRRKINKVNLWAVIVSGIACLGLLCLAIGMIVIVSMLTDKPKMDVNQFTNTESSIVYDSEGNQIAELGATIRENVSYEDLPNVLVDAFVAVEDSRYFEHNGFDVPRFTKAFLSNLRTLSFSQGGSTFTMQLVKNIYFSNDETGEQASRSGISGVTRKVQEIALAMELERRPEINKKIILELYLNKLNFGGNRNIRGVEKAAEYYFGKSVSELNLSESALLAGVINAPTAYNPFNNLEKATARRNEVLYQMRYHGYITEEEYELARCIKVEDLLVDESTRTISTNGVAVPYQAYIDQVVSEVYDMTGKDPYTTAMRIYTYMDRDIQGLMDSIETGTYESISFPDDEFELASIAVNNKTGAIVGILGGRNYANGGSLLLNHATEQFKQPGSSIKPILDYALAFENLGWSTSHVLVDRPIVYPGTSTIISNSNGTYQGQVTLRDALCNSLNTPAIQTLQAVLDAKGYAYVVDYLNAMGIEIAAEDFDIQCGIGGNKIQVSCLQMAGAQGALLNYGQYTKPHTVSRIEFLDGKTPITPVYTSDQTISEEAAYMISTLLNSNVSGGYANLMQILIDDYPVYAKTGTTDWGNSGTSYGIPTGAIKDAWMIGSTTDYTVATWIGYERAQKDKQSYITLNDYLSNIQGRTTNAILDMTVDRFGQPSELIKPDGVSSITHILATYPYASPIEGMDPAYITTGFIKREYASLVNPQDASVESMTKEPDLKYDLVNDELTIEWQTYPDESAMNVADNTMDISLTRSDGSAIMQVTGRRLFDYSWVYGPIRYKAEIKVNNKKVDTVSSDKNKNTFRVNANPGDSITACAYYAYENQNISSSQRCSTITVDDADVTFTIPSTTVDETYNLLMSKGAKEVIIKETQATAGHNAGDYSVSDDKGNNYAINSSYTMKRSEIMKTVFTITKYTEAEETLSLTKSVPSLSAGSDGICTITASDSSGQKVNVIWTWSIVDASEVSSDATNLKISVSESETGVLEIRCNNESLPGTIYITATHGNAKADTTLTIK